MGQADVFNPPAGRGRSCGIVCHEIESEKHSFTVGRPKTKEEKKTQTNVVAVLLKHDFLFLE